jgi:hypothetical protein
MRQTGLLVLCATLFSTLPAGAGIIYGDPTPPFDAPLAPVSDMNGLSGLSVYTAGALVLGEAASVIRDIHWWGFYGRGADLLAEDDFTIEIFADNGFGAPVITPFYSMNVGDAVSRVATGASFESSVIYAYALIIAPLALTPNTDYYLSIVNNTANDDDIWSWMAAPGGTMWNRGDPSELWREARLEGQWHPAFYLTNDVIPEPASVTLLGLALAGAALRMRRKAG